MDVEHLEKNKAYAGYPEEAIKQMKKLKTMNWARPSMDDILLFIFLAIGVSSIIVFVLFTIFVSPIFIVTCFFVSFIMLYGWVMYNYS